MYYCLFIKPRFLQKYILGKFVVQYSVIHKYKTVIINKNKPQLKLQYQCLPAVTYSSNAQLSLATLKKKNSTNNNPERELKSEFVGTKSKCRVIK